MSQHLAHEIKPENSQQPEPLILILRKARLCRAGTVEGDTAIARLINAVGRAHPLHPHRIKAAVQAVILTTPGSDGERESTMHLDRALGAFSGEDAAQHRRVATETLGKAYDNAVAKHGTYSQAAKNLHLKLARNVFGAQQQPVRS
jgi:hypothetical protein